MRAGGEHLGGNQPIGGGDRFELVEPSELRHLPQRPLAEHSDGLRHGHGRGALSGEPSQHGPPDLVRNEPFDGRAGQVAPFLFIDRELDK